MQRKLRRLVNTSFGQIQSDPHLREFSDKVLDRMYALWPKLRKPLRAPKNQLGIAESIALSSYIDDLWTTIKDIDTRCVETSEKRDRAQQVGSLGDVRKFEHELEQLERQGDKTLTALENARKELLAGDPGLRTLSKYGSMEEFWQSDEVRAREAKFQRLYHELEDLEGLELPPDLQEQKHMAIVKYLQGKRAARLAKKGGKARGQQKRNEGNETRAKVELLLAAGLGTKEIADRSPIGQRRVQQLKAKLADTKS